MKSKMTTKQDKQTQTGLKITEKDQNSIKDMKKKASSFPVILCFFHFESCSHIGEVGAALHVCAQGPIVKAYYEYTAQIPGLYNTRRNCHMLGHDFTSNLTYHTTDVNEDITEVYFNHPQNCREPECPLATEWKEIEWFKKQSLLTGDGGGRGGLNLSKRRLWCERNHCQEEATAQKELTFISGRI